MRSFDFDAVTYDGAVYCVECLPKAPDGYEHQQVTADSDEVSPIFADSEWQTAPVCDACGAVHEYVSILGITDPAGESIQRDDTDRLIGLAFACNLFHGGQRSPGYALMCAIDWKPGTDRASRLADRDEWSEARYWAAHYIRLARRQPSLF